MSLIEGMGLPSQFGITLLLFFFILTIVPLFGGKDFGVLKIPEFEGPTRRRLRVVGPLLLIFAILLHLPILPDPSSESGEAGGLVSGVDNDNNTGAETEQQKSGSEVQSTQPTTTEFTPAELSIVAINIGKHGVAADTIDIFVRNSGTSSVIIHQGVLEILDWKKLPDAFGEGTGPWIPSTYQYNIICNLDDKIYRLAMAQEVEGGSVDRFQISVGLGKLTDKVDPLYGKMIHMQNRNPITGDYLDLIEVKVRLTLLYEIGREVSSEPFNLALASDPNGYQAERLAGLRLEDKFALLEDPSLSVVGSVVHSLQSIGGMEALEALKRLRQRDLSYLKANFLRECSWDSFDCSEESEYAYERFLDGLDYSIKLIEESIDDLDNSL